MMLCPICLADVTADSSVVDRHLNSLTDVCPMSGREPFTWDERSTRAAVPNRSGGRCEMCGQRATNMHHRKNRSQGGRWSPANILHLCGSGVVGCHGYFTSHPSVAYLMGVSVRRGDEPADIAVQTPAGLLWLSDDIAPPLPGWAR
jgi:hypothetical protein